MLITKKYIMNMKTIFKTLALSLVLLTVAACEKHDAFDENMITGAVGPETYWTVESSTAKAGEGMNFIGQYYSTVASIDHSEVWYDLYEKEDKVVTASLIKAFTYSIASSTTEQKRMLQTIESYEHSEDLWSDSLHAYVLEDRFPVSYTLSPISWKQPKDLEGFDKNLTAYFGANYIQEFMAGLMPKMNPSATERHYGAYMNVFQGLSLLTDTIVTPNGDRVPYISWISDSTYNANTATWTKFFKQNDTIWSKVNFDTLGFTVDSAEKYINIGGRPPKFDTVMVYDTTYITKPWYESHTYVYDQILHAIDSVWENHVTFYDLISSTEGYSVEYKREYYINAELRIYDDKGTYSKTDSKEIAIN